nr:unnamed protein product [Callosobruchus analis]
MEAVRCGMAVRAASNEFGIPRRTLRNHVSSGSATKRIGRPCILTEEQELDLESRIVRLADVGMPITLKCLRRSVYKYVEIMKIPHNFPSLTALAGRKWVKLFLKRHPNISRRKAQHMNVARARKLNMFIVADYFKKLKDVMVDTGVMGKPQCIFNIDEKGCQLNVHKQQTVLARKGAKRVHMLTDEHAENVTIVSCGNALGQSIPPMIIMKGIRQKPEWSMHLPPGSILNMTAKGSMTTEMFVKWMDHFSKFKPQGKVLLIFDGASAHLDYRIVDVAEKNDVVLFCLPSNTTHELQPKAVFSPFESYWNDEVLPYWTNNPNHTINKSSFGLIFSKVWPKAASPSNIVSGFRATGIYSYDPNIIPDSAYKPSELSERWIAIPENRGNLDSPEYRGDTETETPASSCPPGTQSKRKPKKNTSPLATKTINMQTPSPPQPGPSRTRKRRRLPVYSSSSDSDDDDDYSLRNTSSSEGEEISFNESFREILPTPVIEEKKVIPRKKSLSYRAQKVTKALFAEQVKKKNETGKSKKIIKNKKVVEAWYCHLCDEDQVRDMRVCSMCSRYVHEECVGLTKMDREPTFICPSCS